MTRNLTVTSAAEWRTKRGVLVELPDTGMVVRIRAVDVSHLVKLGQIPNLLMPLINQMIDDTDGSYRENRDEAKKTPAEQMKEERTLYEEFARLAIIEPKVVIGEAQNDDEVSLNDLSHNDLSFIFYSINQPARALEGYFRIKSQYLERLSNGTEDVLPSEPAPERVPDGESVIEQP